MDAKRLLEHWQDEGESAYLYKILADVEPDARRKNLYLKLADVELQHQQSFAKLLADQGVRVGEFRPGLRARLFGWMARRGGARTVVRLRILDEASEVKNYLREKSSMATGEAAKISQQVARDEALHAETLMKLTGSGGEPWHRMESGGFLRNVVYGFNDGLTANFGLGGRRALDGVERVSCSQKRARSLSARDRAGA